MITFAEDVGLIWHFDLAMAKKVVEWLQPRRANKYKIAVNISGQSIANPAYHAELFALLEANPWTSENMLFEITESARIADLSDANRFFQTLRRKGYEVCLDDFGAGAASFQYLASLDVDVVKLDGSAVKNALAAKKGRAFLSALTKLCKDIGVETVAEMVDDAETLNFVRDCGVDFAQGYLFGKPAIDITVFAKTGLPRIGR
jgi:EAL domain-containing protein (putative c-di-GMP-specific phosphodiesterase class I)